jgi:hypothetical protein
LSEGDAVGVQQYSDEELVVLVKEAHLTGRKVAATPTARKESRPPCARGSIRSSTVR